MERGQTQTQGHGAGAGAGADAGARATESPVGQSTLEPFYSRTRKRPRCVHAHHVTARMPFAARLLACMPICMHAYMHARLERNLIRPEEPRGVAAEAVCGRKGQLVGTRPMAWRRVNSVSEGVEVWEGGQVGVKVGPGEDGVGWE